MNRIAYILAPFFLVFSLLSCSKDNKGKDTFKGNKNVTEENSELIEGPITKTELTKILDTGDLNFYSESEYYSRLTKSEYKYTFKDLLQGLNESELKKLYQTVDGFPENGYVGNFKNRSTTSVFQGIETSQIKLSFLLTDLFMKSEWYKKSCPEGNDCLEYFFKSFIPMVWKRELTNDEQSRLKSLYESSEQGLRDKTLLNVVFLSPSFHNKRLLKNGGDKEVPFSIASSLSYILKGSFLDEQLLADARSGEIAHPNVIRKHVKRLLREFPSRFSRQFVLQWLGFETAMDSMRDKKFKGAPMVSVLQEPAVIFAGLLAGNENLSAFFNLKFHMVNSDLAELYGIKTASGWEKASTIKTLFGLGAFSQKFNVKGKDVPNPVLRGYYLVNHLLCGEVPQPTPEELVAAKGVIEKSDPNWSIKKTMQEYRNNVACKSCHEAFDHHGFALEEIGILEKERSQTYEGTSDEIKSEGNVDGMKFSSSLEFVEKLSQSNSLRACFISQTYSYFTGQGYLEAYKKIVKNPDFSKISEMSLSQMIEDIAVQALSGDYDDK